MADVELLPLHLIEAFSQALKGGRGELDAWLEVNNEADVRLHVEAYARAVAEHNVAARDTEIERLKVVAHGFVDEIAARDAEIESLRAALRHQRWCRTCGEDGWDSCEKGRAAIDLLRDHDQEVGNG